MPGHARNGEEDPFFVCFFGLVAMVSPEAMGRNGSLFCAHPCQHLMGDIGLVDHHPQRDPLEPQRGTMLSRKASLSHK